MKAKQAKGKGGPQVVGCAVEVCAPALELKEIIKRRPLVHNLACAYTDPTNGPTCTSGEAISPVGLAAFEAISNVGMLKPGQYFEPVKETIASAQFM